MDDVDFVISTMRAPDTIGLRTSIDKGRLRLRCLKQFSLAELRIEEYFGQYSRYGAIVAAVTGMPVRPSVLVQGVGNHGQAVVLRASGSETPRSAAAATELLIDASFRRQLEPVDACLTRMSR